MELHNWNRRMSVGSTPSDQAGSMCPHHPWIERCHNPQVLQLCFPTDLSEGYLSRNREDNHRCKEMTKSYRHRRSYISLPPIQLEFHQMDQQQAKKLVRYKDLNQRGSRNCRRLWIGRHPQVYQRTLNRKDWQRAIKCIYSISQNHSRSMWYRNYLIGKGPRLFQRIYGHYQQPQFP